MDFKTKMARFKALDGERIIDDDLFIIHPSVVQVYLQAGIYSHPCFICGIYAELYIRGNCRSVYIEDKNALPYRVEFKVGDLDEHGYFHYTAEENAQEVQAA